MPFIPHTPESLLARSDSKDPATTCKGITSSGRPCRRSLAISPRSSPSPRAAIGGVLAVVPADSNEGGNAETAVFFCWQHKEQAERVVAEDTKRDVGQKKRTVQLRERTSVETMIDRLGLLEVGDARPKKTTRDSHDRYSKAFSGKKISLESEKSRRGSSMTGKEETAQHSARNAALPRHIPHQKTGGETNFIVSLFCCVRSMDREDLQPPRPRPQSHNNLPRRGVHSKMEKTPGPGHRFSNESAYAEPEKPLSTRIDRILTEHPPTARATTKSAASRVPLPAKTAQPILRPPLHHDPPSRTQNLLSLIPKTLAPQTTSALLSELAKPISDFDEEGYIYMFWLTDASSTPVPSPRVAASLLTSSPTTTSQTQTQTQARRPSAALQDPQTPPRQEAPTYSQGTILLKIGRASNVHRRLNQWSRQCGHDLSLIRYYPYIPTSSPLPLFSSHNPHPNVTQQPLTPPLTPPHKVQHAHRVERLIHIELADKRVKRKCGVCGKEHREWFEVEGTREGVRGVDEVVGRWVRWGEGLTVR
ncbi:hypothetical protein MMC16_000477 [Acarospora aff. strigata]|nr:hypothetical protein [Acarospora aff. strigata]